MIFSYKLFLEKDGGWQWWVFLFTLYFVFSFFFFNLFIWLCQALVVTNMIFNLWWAGRVFSCAMWDLVPWPGIEPRPPALGVQSLSHWTTREVPCFFKDGSLKFSNLNTQEHHWGDSIVLYLFKKYLLFIWLHWVLVVACRFFSCGMWDLVPQPGIEHQLPCWKLRVLTTAPPGKFLLLPYFVLNFFLVHYFDSLLISFSDFVFSYFLSGRVLEVTASVNNNLVWIKPT